MPFHRPSILFSFLVWLKIEMFENTHRRADGNIHLLEKQLRPEVIERTLQFLDVIINQIIYQENIYHSGISLSN